MRWLVGVAASTIVTVAPPGAAGTQTSTLTVGFAAYSSDPVAIGVGATGATATIDAVWISIQDIRLRSRAACERSLVPAAFAGPITAELVAGRTSGLPASGAEVAMGRFCAVELAYRRARGKTQEAPADLQDMSIAVIGARGDGVRFVLRTRLAFASLLHARELEGFLIARRHVRLVIAADVARWMSGLDLGAADPGPDPRHAEIRIDAQSNADLLAAFLRNLDAGIAVFDDVNDDGALDYKHPITASAR